MELSSGRLVRLGHRHRHRPGDARGGCSERGEDFYVATREDICVATREDFFMAMDTPFPRTAMTRFVQRRRGTRVRGEAPQRERARTGRTGDGQTPLKSEVPVYLVLLRPRTGACAG